MWRPLFGINHAHHARVAIVVRRPGSTGRKKELGRAAEKSASRRNRPACSSPLRINTGKRSLTSTTYARVLSLARSFASITAVNFISPAQERSTRQRHAPILSRLQRHIRLGQLLMLIRQTQMNRPSRARPVIMNLHHNLRCQSDNRRRRGACTESMATFSATFPPTGIHVIAGDALFFPSPNKFRIHPSPIIRLPIADQKNTRLESRMCPKECGRPSIEPPKNSPEHQQRAFPISVAQLADRW